MQQKELIVSTLAFEGALKVSAFHIVDDVAIRILRVSHGELKRILVSEDVALLLLGRIDCWINGHRFSTVSTILPIAVFTTG